MRAAGDARFLAEKEAVEIRYYSVIYNLLDEVKLALSGMLAPETREEIVGIAEVRDVFRSPKYGAIAGCMVTEGTVYRNKPIRVLREISLSSKARWNPCVVSKMKHRKFAMVWNVVSA